MLARKSKHRLLSGRQDWIPLKDCRLEKGEGTSVVEIRKGEGNPERDCFMDDRRGTSWVIVH